ncbi:SDR family NAD(P)-dependent oxidoreductase [Shigella sonnei]|nr:SDR family NAD(P)-dependent oxidoreductase [Shigella sonnei]EJC9873794.1 SDR family NAD(P)-dependent oxidoreductase [Shigella sonnei]
MNQVAVVIGGGQTLGAFLCHGLAAEGYRVAVVDIQSDKAANVAQEINAEYGEGTAYSFGADATSEQSVLALSRGVDEIFGRVDLLVYSAAKFGGVGLTQSLALDLAEYGITVHSLMLGNLLKSPMFQSLLPQYATKLGIKPDQVEQYYIDKVPLKRGCDYQDVLNMLLLYASPKASYCTGQSINVTGGQVML